MEDKYIIYCHTSPDGKKYIGQTKEKNPNERWQNGKGYSGCIVFFDAIVKYGWINFKHEILEYNLNKEEAYEKEAYYISYFNTTNFNYGYNIKLGGNKSRMTDYIKQKISKANKGRIVSEETRKKISLNNKRGFIGRHHTEETKEAIRNKKESKKVMCIETGIIYKSIREVEREFEISHISISRCCRGVNKTAGGYHWKFIEKEVM